MYFLIISVKYKEIFVQLKIMMMISLGNFKVSYLYENDSLIQFESGVKFSLNKIQYFELKQSLNLLFSKLPSKTIYESQNFPKRTLTFLLIINLHVISKIDTRQRRKFLVKHFDTLVQYCLLLSIHIVVQNNCNETL